MADVLLDVNDLLRGSSFLQFQVRVDESSKLDAATGYQTAIKLVLEKGDKKTFQAICDGLQRDWYYDVLPTPTSILLRSS